MEVYLCSSTRREFSIRVRVVILQINKQCMMQWYKWVGAFEYFWCNEVSEWWDWTYHDYNYTLSLVHMQMIVWLLDSWHYIHKMADNRYLRIQHHNPKHTCSDHLCLYDECDEWYSRRELELNVPYEDICKGFVWHEYVEFVNLWVWAYDVKKTILESLETEIGLHSEQSSHVSPHSQHPVTLYSVTL